MPATSVRLEGVGAHAVPEGNGDFLCALAGPGPQARSFDQPWTGQEGSHWADALTYELTRGDNEMTNQPLPSRDELYASPYIDIDEWRGREVHHRYVHGGFTGTEV